MIMMFRMSNDKLCNILIIYETPAEYPAIYGGEFHLSYCGINGWNVLMEKKGGLESKIP
jgi:hypothetical protein